MDTARQPNEDVETLATYRLDRQWTIQQVADAMTRAGWPVPKRTLASLFAKPEITPQPLTLHAIRKFLESERAAGRLPFQREAQRA